MRVHWRKSCLGTIDLAKASARLRSASKGASLAIRCLCPATRSRKFGSPASRRGETPQTAIKKPAGRAELVPQRQHEAVSNRIRPGAGRKHTELPGIRLLAALWGLATVLSGQGPLGASPSMTGCFREGYRIVGQDGSGERRARVPSSSAGNRSEWNITDCRAEPRPNSRASDLGSPLFR